MIVGRFLMRFLLVPLGWCVAVAVGAVIIIIANWDAFLAVGTGTPEQQQNFWLLLFFFGPMLLLALGYAGLVMMGLAGIGVLISEAFALRSWIFHAANGGLSAAIGWTMITELQTDLRLVGDLKVIVAAGLAAGLSYWLVAGWSAGFWKPVFSQDLQPLPPVLSPPPAPTSPTPPTRTAA
jgi:hypothetical protein